MVSEAAMSSYCEIPFLSATTLDDALTSSGSGKAALQKYRQEMRRKLDPGMRISVGRGGTLQLTSVPALACIATATRWNMHDALKLMEIYKKAGFGDLSRSKDYKYVMSLVGEAVRARVRSNEAGVAKTALMEIIPGCWEELTTEYKEVRSLTECMHDIFVKVDQQAEQMKRWAGRLVRFEGANALVTIETGEREQLRTVDSGYLKSAGIHRNGTPFVLHEYRWSPDTTMSLFFPAFDLNYDAKAEAALLERLNNYARPLPEPPVGLLPVDFIPGESRPAANPAPVRAETTRAAEPVRVETARAEPAPRAKVSAS
jgi:hypothetical protein